MPCCLNRRLTRGTQNMIGLDALWLAVGVVFAAVAFFFIFGDE